MLGPSTRPAVAVASVHVERGLTRPPDPGEEWELETLILAVFEDGRVVWSEEGLRGGQPHRQGQISVGDVQRLLTELTAAAKGLPRNDVVYMPPDASAMFINFRDSSGRYYHVGSCHELVEANGRSVSVDGGILPLDGQTKEEALRSAPPEFLKVRAIWSKWRAILQGVIPREGTPATEKVRFEPVEVRVAQPQH